MSLKESPVEGTVETSAEDLVGEDIICFAKDWSEDPTCNNHVMRQLARGNRVLWLNSIGARKPNLTNRRDLRKIFHKLSSFFQGPREIHENLWIYTPLVLPLPHSAIATSINRQILKLTLRRLKKKLAISKFQLWSFLPNVVDYFGTLGETVSVYYCTDNYSNFAGIDTERMVKMERRLCRKADIVFATSNMLVEERRPLNANVHLASHGVDYGLFSCALDDATPLPDDMAGLSGPILGFYGLIEDWMDQDLIAYLAERHPEWTFVFIGRVCVDISRLEQRANVRFLGRKPHADLPRYCKGFTVALIPHKVNDLTIHMNPMKLREYLCAGLPIVSIDLPEVRYYENECIIASTREEFERGIETAIRLDSREARSRRSATMRSETWEQKVRQLGQRVMRVKRDKAGRKGRR